MKTDLLVVATLTLMLGGCTKGMTEIGEFDDSGSSTGQPGDSDGSGDSGSGSGSGSASGDSGSGSASDDAPVDTTGESICLEPGEGCDPEACYSMEEGIDVAMLQDGECMCSPMQRCLSWGEVEGIGGSAAPGCYFDPRTGEVAAHSTIWIDLPLGWLHCGDEGSPPACACCQDAMGCTPGPVPGG